MERELKRAPVSGHNSSDDDIEMSAVNSGDSKSGDEEASYDIPPAPAPASIYLTAGACLLYGGSALVMSLTNKAVLSVYKFNFLFTLIFLQQLCCMILCSLLKKLGYVQFADLEKWKLKKVSVLSVTALINVYCGFEGLRLVNVPVFLTLRKLVPVFTLVVNYLMTKKKESVPVVLSLLVASVGALLTGSGDLDSDVIGYFWTLANNVATAAYFTLVAKISKAVELNSFGMLFYNSIILAPLSLTAAFLMGETQKLSEYPYLTDIFFQLGLFLSCTLAVALVYGGFLCSIVNSPLATSVTGSTKDVLGILLGYFIFQDVHLTEKLVTGILVCLVSSTWYTVLKLQESNVLSSFHMTRFCLPLSRYTAVASAEG